MKQSTAKGHSPTLIILEMSIKEKLIRIVQCYQEDRVPERAAALAFYSLMGLAPMLLLSVLMMKVLPGAELFVSQVLNFFDASAGTATADFIARVMFSLERLEFGPLYSVFGIVILLYAIARLFGELDVSFRDVFNLRSRSDVGFSETVRKYRGGLVYFISLLAFIVVITLFNIFFSVFFELTSEALFGGLPDIVARVVSTFVYFLIALGVFGFVYRRASRKTISWRASFVGGVAGALLFIILNVLFTMIIGWRSTLSAYGAALLLVVFLLWVYYAFGSLLVGGEVAKVYHDSDAENESNTSGQGTSELSGT